MKILSVCHALHKQPPTVPQMHRRPVYFTDPNVKGSDSVAQFLKTLTCLLYLFSYKAGFYPLE